nr:XdhC/CoxI family protein [Tissierella sp.]
MADLSVLKETMELIDAREQVAVATITRATGSAPRGVGTMMAVLKDRKIIGTIGGGALENHVIDLSLDALKSGKSESHKLRLDDKKIGMICGGEVDVFIDVYRNKPKLMIFGGGHVGFAIYEQALLLDFDISIFDDREEFLNKERFPHASELVMGDIEETLKDYKIDKNTYIVVVTRGHKCDQEALEMVVNSEAAYIGAMGSKKKVIEMMEHLKEKGFSEEILKRVYAPIGLDIASEEPKEIAVSIMSEVLLVKNKGNAEHRRL